MARSRGKTMMYLNRNIELAHIKQSVPLTVLLGGSIECLKRPVIMRLWLAAIDSHEALLTYRMGKGRFLVSMINFN